MPINIVHVRYSQHTVRISVISNIQYIMKRVQIVNLIRMSCKHLRLYTMKTGKIRRVWNETCYFNSRKNRIQYYNSFSRVAKKKRKEFFWCVSDDLKVTLKSWLPLRTFIAQAMRYSLLVDQRRPVIWIFISSHKNARYCFLKYHWEGDRMSPTLNFKKLPLNSPVFIVLFSYAI